MDHDNGGGRPLELGTGDSETEGLAVNLWRWRKLMISSGVPTATQMLCETPSLQYSGDPWALAPQAPPSYKHEARSAPGIGDPFARGAAEYIGPNAVAQGAYGAGHGITNMLANAYGGQWDKAAEDLPVALAIFAGVKAKTANLPMLERAQGMAAKGATRDVIRNETGWHQGADGKWRWEIDDSASRMKPEWTTPHERNVRGDVQLQDVFEHPALFEAYPQMKSNPFTSDVPPGGGHGGFEPKTGTIFAARQPPSTRDVGLIDVNRLMAPAEQVRRQALEMNQDMWRPPTQLELAMAFMPGARVPIPTGRIRAYHGSPKDFDTFQTPAFFSNKEGIAKSYRNDGGGMDNLNGLGGKEPPLGYYTATHAMDEVGNNDRAKAIQLLTQRVNEFSGPRPSDYEPRGFLDKLLGRPAKLMPGTQEMYDRQRAFYQSGIDHLQSGAPLGRMYEVSLPEPTAHYGAGWSAENQSADIANAIAKGHKVITWGARPGLDSGEIIALDPTVIQILRKYGIGAPVAASILEQAYGDKSQQ